MVPFVAEVPHGVTESTSRYGGLDHRDLGWSGPAEHGSSAGWRPAPGAWPEGVGLPVQYGHVTKFTIRDLICLRNQSLETQYWNWLQDSLETEPYVTVRIHLVKVVTYV